MCKNLTTTLNMCTNKLFYLTCSRCQDADQHLKNANCSSLDHGGENDKSLCPNSSNATLETSFHNGGCQIEMIKMNNMQVANEIEGIKKCQPHSNTTILIGP